MGKVLLGTNLPVCRRFPVEPSSRAADTLADILELSSIASLDKPAATSKDCLLGMHFIGAAITAHFPKLGRTWADVRDKLCSFNAAP